MVRLRDELMETLCVKFLQTRYPPALGDRCVIHLFQQRSFALDNKKKILAQAVSDILILRYDHDSNLVKVCLSRVIIESVTC